MVLQVIAIVSITAGLLSVCGACLAVRRVKRQISEMLEALADVRNGNGNRRLLAVSHELAAPLAYEINGVIRAYESRLADICRTEEANRQLMTSLSHDIRTPLTTLIGYLEAARRIPAGEKEREDYVETARRKAYRLKEYIDTLFDWFRLNSGEFAMQISTVEIAEATRELLIDWIPLLEDRQIRYSVDIPEEPVPVRLDMDGYGRIVNNLLQNALTHSHGDAIGLTLARRGGSVEIVISDNGIGMEKEDLRRVFERLYQCGRGRPGKGSGLGLSIASQLARKMGGRITAESTLGKGTSFTVSFPIFPG